MRHLIYVMGALWAMWGIHIDALALVITGCTFIVVYCLLDIYTQLKDILRVNVEAVQLLRSINVQLLRSINERAG